MQAKLIRLKFKKKTPFICANYFASRIDMKQNYSYLLLFILFVQKPVKAKIFCIYIHTNAITNNQYRINFRRLQTNARYVEQHEALLFVCTFSNIVYNRWPDDNCYKYHANGV